MRVHLDPDPDDAYHAAPPLAAEWADQVMDWLEEEPVNPHARRRRFQSGFWAVVATLEGQEWVIVWEQVGDEAHIRYLGGNRFGLS